MFKTLSLNNLVDIEADSIKIQDKDIHDIFLTKTGGSDIVGLAPSTLDTLNEIAQAIGNDSEFITTINDKLDLKRNISDSYDKIYINNLISNYNTIEETTTLLNTKLNANVINNYYNKTEVDTFLNLRYTKTETDNLLDLKSDKLDTYTIESVNNLLDNKLDITTFNAGIILKANIEDTYNKTLLYTKLETDNLLNLKSNIADTYNKTSVDNLLNDKLNISTYNDGIILKANIADVYNKSLLYTKSETTAFLLNKADKTALGSYYNKTEINEAFSNYYDKTYINNEFDKYYLKTFIDNLLTDLNDSINLKFDSSGITNYYSKTETDTLFSNLIGNAGESLDTLKELADALNNDANYAATVENQIASKRNIADSYNKDEVNAIFNTDKHIVKTSTLEFKDVNNANVDTLLIKGGDYITITDNINNPLMDLDSTQISITPLLYCFNNLVVSGDATISNMYNITQIDDKLDTKLNNIDAFVNNYLYIFGDRLKLYSTVNSNGNFHGGAALTHATGDKLIINDSDYTGGVEIGSNCVINGDLTANNIYNKTSVDDLLNNKQNQLIDRGGTGSILIDFNDNKVSRIFGNNGISVTRYLNLADTNDPNNFNIQIDGTNLQNSINSKLNSFDPTIGGNLTVTGAEIKMYNTSRAGGNVHLGRALVHGNNDTLIINYANDYTGNVRIMSDCVIDGNVTSPNINTLQTSVNTNTFDISTLDLNLTSGLNARFTKTESDDRYYFKTDNIFEVQKLRAMSSNFPNISDAVFFYDGVMDVIFNLISENLVVRNNVDINGNLKVDGNIGNGNSISMDVGRGDVYFENFGADNQDGSGLTLRVAQNPTQGALFSVRSSGSANRFWVGQSLTSSGTNDFGICYPGGYDDFHDKTQYKHLFTSTGAELTGDINITGNLNVNGANISSSGGGGITRIEENSLHTEITGGSGGVQLRNGDSSLLIETNSAGTIIMNNLTVLGTVKKTPIAFDCYNNIAGDSATSVNVDVVMPLNITRFNSSQFTLNSNIVTVNANIVANIIYRISTDVVSTSGLRTSSRAVLQIDTGNGWGNVAGTFSFMYNRQGATGEDTATVSIIMSLQVGYRFRVLFRKIQNNDTIQCIPGGCGFSITAL